jgi:predicted lipoprotein with Yx(FWY)xxD motif
MQLRLPPKGNSLIPRRILLSLVVGLAASFLLGACDSSNGTGSDSAASVAPAASDPATSTPVASPSKAGASSSSGDGTTTTAVTAKAMNGLGNVVTDNNGKTLYRFDKDEPSPSKWTCKGACTMTWIPVIVQDSVQTSGVEKSLLGTVHRNGLKQLTLAGWPLYRYVGDTAAGEANGQGKDNAWYAITPSGQKSAVSG